MFKLKNSFFNILTLLLILFVSISPSIAANKKIEHSKSKKASFTPLATTIVADSKNGKLLHAVNHNKLFYPASLTKLMTLYLIFEKLTTGQYKLDSQLKISNKAMNMPPSKLNIKAGEHISVHDAILALIIKSANDVSVVIAENIAGSEENFAKKMNIKAKKLGMKNTNFVNASGLHDPKQKTTAVDMLKLTMAIKRDFPHFYPLFSKTSFTYKDIVVNGHNKVLKNYEGAKGMKTGFHRHAGYNLITTADRNNNHLIGIVTGCNSAAERDKKMMNLLDKHFALVNNQKIKAINHKNETIVKKNAISISPSKKINKKKQTNKKIKSI